LLKGFRRKRVIFPLFESVVLSHNVVGQKRWKTRFSRRRNTLDGKVLRRTGERRRGHLSHCPRRDSRDPPLGPRLHVGSREHVKYGFVAEFADFDTLISFFGDFLPRLGCVRPPLVGYRFINTCRKHGRNRLSISFDGHRDTHNDETQYAPRAGHDNSVGGKRDHACGGLSARHAPAIAAACWFVSPSLPWCGRPACFFAIVIFHCASGKPAAST
jgi:hypothetical protein